MLLSDFSKHCVTYDNRNSFMVPEMFLSILLEDLVLRLGLLLICKGPGFARQVYMVS